MKALVGAFYQKEALVGAFSVILKTDGSFAALQQTAGQAQAKIRSAGLKFDEFTASATGSWREKDPFVHLTPDLALFLRHFLHSCKFHAALFARSRAKCSVALV